MKLFFTNNILYTIIFTMDIKINSDKRAMKYTIEGEMIQVSLFWLLDNFNKLDENGNSIFSIEQKIKIAMAFGLKSMTEKKQIQTDVNINLQLNSIDEKIRKEIQKAHMFDFEIPTQTKSRMTYTPTEIEDIPRDIPANEEKDFVTEFYKKGGENEAEQS